MLSNSTNSATPLSRPSWLSLLAFAFTILALCASTASALPANQRRAAMYEPLFARASAQIGPNAPIERLRQRRSLPARSKPAIIERAPSSRHVIPNPKGALKGSPLAKRAPEPMIINPKASFVAAEPDAPIARRSSPVGLLRLFLGQSREKRSPKAFRDFTTPRTIPNPKSPSFAARSTEDCPDETTTTTKTTTTTTTKAATTTTTHTTTTVKPATTTTVKPATTTTTIKTTTKLTTTTMAPTTTTRTTTKTTTTTTKAATPTVSAASWPLSGGMIAGAYYPDWEGDVLPPENIKYSLFDLIHFAFAVPTSDFNVTFTQWNSEDLLARIVRMGHANGTKIAISIGGWTDSGTFSLAVRTSAARTTFVNNIVAMVKRTGVDGVDIDWEYPGTQGNPGNVVSSTDTANYLLFLQALRAALPKARLSTCTTQQAFIGADGNPLADVSAFAKVLDSVLVMNYDVWGASSTPGPNAPLSNACPNSNQPNANELSAIQAWTAAGMPASKILMGVPGYGYVSASTKTTLINKRALGDISNRAAASALLREAKRNAEPEAPMSPFHRSYVLGRNKALRRRRASRRAARGGDVFAKREIKTVGNETIIFCPNDHSGKPCAGVTGQNISQINWNPLNSTKNSTGNSSEPGVFNGNIGKTKLGKGDLTGLQGNQIAFWEMINYGVLVKNTPDFVGTNGYTRAWDNCSSTPYLYDVSRKTVITYDDPHSMGLKGQLAYNQGIGGLLMWEMSQDTTDFQLTQSWRSSMYLQPNGYKAS